jgi:tight adherence protein C
LKFLGSLIPQREAQTNDIKRELIRAGNYHPNALRQYLAFRNGTVVVILLLTLGVFWSEAGNKSVAPTLLMVGVTIAILSFGVPRLVLQAQANARVHRIQIGLPDALDVISMSVAAGLPMRDALRHVGKEIRLSYPDLATEFEIIQRQADAGSIGHAFERFAERTGSTSIRTLATIVGQTERLGTHVDQAIEDYAAHIRRASRQRAEEHANKISVKMIFPILFCLMPPVFILLLGGPILELRDYFTGRDGNIREILEQASSMPPPSQPGSGITP